MANPRDYRHVLNGRSLWSCQMGFAHSFLEALPDDSIDMLVTSPPYEDARTYGLRTRFPKGEAWVRFMFDLVTIASRKVKGSIFINCEGKTKKNAYSGVPFLLMADLKRAGFNLVKPVAYHRHGIPGSGGKQKLRNDWEPVIWVTRPGPLPWSDNKACGHTPKHGPGGSMSYRMTDGTRVNQWGGTPTKSGARRKSGKRQAAVRPSHRVVMTRKRDGMNNQDQAYSPPVIANPGNVLRCKVGGGHMGDPLCHDNEAPFPERFAEFFIKSYAAPGAIILDPFCGSGTTAKMAVLLGRRFIGCDLRLSQVKLTERRMNMITPPIPGLE